MGITEEQTISKSILFKKCSVFKVLQVTLSGVYKGLEENAREIGHRELDDKVMLKNLDLNIPPASIHCVDTCHDDGQT